MMTKTSKDPSIIKRPDIVSSDNEKAPNPIARSPLILDPWPRCTAHTHTIAHAQIDPTGTLKYLWLGPRPARF